MKSRKLEWCTTIEHGTCVDDCLCTYGGCKQTSPHPFSHSEYLYYRRAWIKIITYRYTCTLGINKTHTPETVYTGIMRICKGFCAKFGTAPIQVSVGDYLDPRAKPVPQYRWLDWNVRLWMTNLVWTLTSNINHGYPCNISIQ